MKTTWGTIVGVMAVAILMGTLTKADYATAGEIGRDGRFIAYDNDTVLDTKTMLMWAAKDNGTQINWANAKYYCENYGGGGYADWRMPTQDELAGLYNPSLMGYPLECGSQYGRAKLTNFISVTCCCPWASETVGSDGGYFSFNYGLRYWYPKSYVSLGRALPVRTAEKRQAPAVATVPQEAFEKEPAPIEKKQLAAVAAVPQEVFEKRRATIAIEFDTNEAVIKPKYRDEIKKFADVMNSHPELNVVIEGHTDNVGSAGRNQKLSEKRANSVRDYMIKEFGIAESRLTAKGFGESKPIDNNGTPEGAQRNRRVEATVDYTVKR